MKRTILPILTVLPLAIASVGCGDPNKKSEAQKGQQTSTGGQEYVLLDGTELKTEGDSISGKGAVAFLAPRTEDANSYELAFELADGGSLTLVTNAQEKLERGVETTFTREGAKLKASLATTDGAVDISESFAKVDASKPLAFVVDVHNNERPVHALIWTSGATYKLANALFDAGNSDVEGYGRGRLWGLRLAGATVQTAKADEAKAAH